MVFVALACVVLILLVAHAVQAHWMFPPTLLCVLWVVTLGAYALAGDGVHPLAPATVEAILVGVVLFTLGASIPVFAARAGDVPSAPLARAPAPVVHWPFWLATLGLPFYLLTLYGIGSTGPTDSVLLNIRLALTEEAGGASRMGAIAYLVPLSITATALYVSGLVTTDRWKLALLVVVSLFYCVFATGRTFFLLLFAATGGILAVTGRIRARTFIAVGGGAFLVVFALVAFTSRRLPGGDDPTVSSLLTAFEQYLIGGTAALNLFLKTDAPLLGGENTFRLLFAIGHRLGWTHEPRLLVQQFVSVPFETNVYTALRPYYEDFSWPGIALAELAFGLAHGAAFLKASRGSRAGALVYGLLLYPLLMQSFQDQYFALSSTWLQALALLAAVALWTRTRPFDRRAATA